LPPNAIARIPDDVLARLKAEVSVRLVEGVGVVLRRQGNDLVGACPFHEDSSPSLLVSPAKNLWHCLWACQAGGGPVDWVMTAQGVSFRHEVSAASGALRAVRPAARTIPADGPNTVVVADVVAAGGGR
jgi:DNA primase